MEFIDTHTHLYDAAFGTGQEKEEAVRRAISAGVTRMVLPDVNGTERNAMLSLCSTFPDNCFPCLGLHPTDARKDNWKDELDLLETALDAHPDIVAIGEIGMDLYWEKDEETAVRQEEVFRVQLDIAAEKGLPVIIHSRDATDNVFRILEDYRGKGLKGSFHAFSGSIETFRRLERYGDWYVGIGGVLTFKNASIAKTVTDIPLERILLETDSPYLTPVPHRGQRNESSYIPLIAAFLAERKCIETEQVASITSRNGAILFKI